MKKRLSLVLALLMLTSAFAGCSSQSDVPMGMVRASNEIVDYDLFVPDEWTVDLTGGAVEQGDVVDDDVVDERGQNAQLIHLHCSFLLSSRERS